MSTSGSFDFSLTAAQLIARSAKNLGILEAGGTINSNDESDLLQTLNVISKECGPSDGAPGLKVHTRQRITLFLAKGQQTYLVGPANTDARCTTQAGRTTIRASEAIAQTTLDVTARTDTVSYPGTTVTMTDSDIIGVEQNDGTILWSTISSSSGSGPTVTIVSGLEVAAASGNYVWWFTSRAQRFTYLEAAVLRNENSTDTEISVYEDVRQYDLGVVDKRADGQPTALLWEPLRTNTRITLNSQPTDVTSQIVLTAWYPSEDYDATTNDIAFPQEWFGFLEWELTLRSCPSYGKKWTPEMNMNYVNAKSRSTNLNPEKSVLYFQPG